MTERQAPPILPPVTRERAAELVRVEREDCAKLVERLADNAATPEQRGLLRRVAQVIRERTA